MKLLAALGIAIAGLAAAAFAGVAQPTGAHGAAADPSPATITVTGIGSVTTVPDRGSLDLTVETRRQTAAAAMTQNGVERTTMQARAAQCAAGH